MSISSPSASGASGAFELASFELVRAGERSVLLRLTAFGSAGDLSAASLLADDGRRVRELRRVPEPSPARGSTGPTPLAFVAGPELFGGRPAFALRLGDDTLVDLPAPRERRPARAVSRKASPDSEQPLAEARRQALLVVQRDLEDERASHAETRTEADELRIELTRARSVIGRLRSELEEARATAEQAESALAAARRERSELSAALAAARTDAQERETHAETRLADITARLEAETARHVATAERSADERVALESQIAEALEELSREREEIGRSRAELAQVAAARDDAQRRVAEHRDALVLFEAALDLQIESAAAADEEVDALDREVEADTQSILRLVRSARARDLGDAAVSSPFPRWEQTRRRLARWAGGDEGEGALSPAEEPARSARPGVSSS